jgi:hypothetical protein
MKWNQTVERQIYMVVTEFLPNTIATINHYVQLDWTFLLDIVCFSASSLQFSFSDNVWNGLSLFLHVKLNVVRVLHCPLLSVGGLSILCIAEYHIKCFSVEKKGCCSPFCPCADTADSLGWTAMLWSRLRRATTTCKKSYSKGFSFEPYR